MKGSKGIFQMAELSVVTFIIIVAVASIGVQKVVVLDEIINRETLPLEESRVESAVYMLDGVERGEVQINFSDTYSLEQRNGKIMMIYSIENNVYTGGQSEVAVELDPVNSESLELGEEGSGESFCAEKQGDSVELSPGECSG